MGKNKSFLNEANSRINRVGFRDKTESWKKYHIRYDFDSGERSKLYSDDDLYFKAYMNKLSMRPSCYSCAFKEDNRASDITLADFWGIEEVLPEMDDDRGTTLLICHNEKGERLVNCVTDKMLLSPVDYTKAIKK